MNPVGHSLMGIEQQNATTYNNDEHRGTFTELHKAPVTFNSGVSNEQQVIYSSAPMIYHTGNIPPSYICLQTLPNGQTVNHYQANRFLNQFQSQQHNRQFL